MPLPQHSGTPLRQHILRRVGALMAVTSVLLAFSFVGFGLWPMADQMAKQQFAVAASRVESGLSDVFLPAERLLAMSQGWVGGRAPDLASPDAFNQVFEPVLRVMPQLTAVVAGSSSGQGWLLLQQADGSWRNRMTDIPKWGTQRHLLLDQLPDGRVRRHWDEKTYDPRLRPWFKGAMAMPIGQKVYWTPPYPFFATREAGMTASIRTRLADGRDFVLGFDLTLRNLSNTTLGASVGKRGLALVITEDERVLALPTPPSQVAQVDWLRQVLQPVAALGMASVSDGLAHWKAAGGTKGSVLTYPSAGVKWMITVHPYVLGEQQLSVVVLAPAADFAPVWWPMGLALGLALLVMAALALWLIRVATQRLSRPLEALALTSQRIGQLDFQPGEPITSGVAEVQTLVANQQTMLGMLRDNQQELDARAAQLSTQIAALRETEARLQLQNDQLSTIIENFPGGVAVVDAGLRIVAFNSEFKSLLGLPPELMARADLVYADVICFNAQRGDYGPGDVQAQVAERVAHAKLFQAHRFEWTLPNGLVLEVRGMPLPQGGFVSVYADVTAAKQHERELEHLAHFDALTGLPNRVLLADRLRQGMTQVARRHQQLAVAYLDLDGFKQVNDQHGHEVGDQLLLALSGRMKRALRDGDTLARLGGDEFVAVLQDVAGLDGSVPMLRRLLVAADAPVMLGPLTLEVSASIGVTFYPQNQEVDAEQLLRQADHAMYQAKQSGKNRYHVFDSAHDNQLRGQLEGLERVRQALHQGEFVLYYQPKVNMRSGQVMGAEALIRWQHPERGVLLPGVFLPLIEEHALAVELGQWVIEQALLQMSRWLAEGAPVPVSVNVSARQLQQGGFVAHLRAALAHYPQINPCDLMLEVLETSALEDMARVTEVMTQCRSMGVHYALDDFGTGYSSLTYLKRLPVSQLKIDRSFVRDMLDDPDDLSILVGVLDMSASFQRQVIAEGVETVAHGQMLLRLGCDLAQGFGIARPMPAADWATWAAQWRSAPLWRDVNVVSRQDLPLLFACAEHRAWVAALEAFLKGECEATQALDKHRFYFAQWLEAGGLVRHAGEPAASTIEPLHLQLHDLATQACALQAQGQTQAALARLPPLLALRDELLAQLESLLP